MAAAASSSSSSSASEIDELRGALASKGLVLKDSILARVARSKSLKDLVVPTETAGETRREEALKEEEAEAEADEELGFEKRLRALINDGSKKEDHEAAVDVGSKEEEREAEKELFVVNDEDENVEKKDGKQKQEVSDNIGVSSLEAEKLKKRAARFGTANNDNKEEEEKKRARAARFGIADEDAKKKARIERFSKSLVDEDPIEVEKRKARAARFAIVANEN